MRESMWGIFIIVLGAVGIIAINLFQSLTVTNDQTYFLMKETTKAAMGDAVDLSYYKSTGKVRIVESKFVENLTRRFAQSAALNKNYNIVIHDVVEEPPKVSLSILTNGQDLKQNNYDIFQKIDSIYEAIYKKSDLYDEKYFEDYDEYPGSPGTTPEYPYEDGKCPNANSGIDECISGDLQFLGWGAIAQFNDEVCPEDLARLNPVNRDATYKACVCGKWEDPTTVVVNSGRPRIVANKATYTWTFKKDGPLNDIDTTVKSEVVAGICPTDLKILIQDDLPRTITGGVECPPEGISILVNDVQRLYPRYIPKESINRTLTWTSNNDDVSLVKQNGSVLYPNKDYVDVIGKREGRSTVTATTSNNKSDDCLVRVIKELKCPTYPVELMVGSVGQAILENNEKILGMKYSISNSNVATIDSNGVIRVSDDVKQDQTISYTISVGSKSVTCDLKIKADSGCDDCPIPDPVGGGCGVGNMSVVSWSFPEKPAACATTINNDLNAFTKNVLSNADLTLNLCSKTTPFSSCTGGTWDSREVIPLGGFSNKATVSSSVKINEASKTYTVSVTANVNNIGWQKALVDSSCRATNPTQTFTTSFSGSLLAEEGNVDCALGPIKRTAKISGQNTIIPGIQSATYTLEFLELPGDKITWYVTVDGNKKLLASNKKQVSVLIPSSATKATLNAEINNNDISLSFFAESLPLLVDSTACKILNIISENCIIPGYSTLARTDTAARTSLYGNSSWSLGSKLVYDGADYTDSSILFKVSPTLSGITQPTSSTISLTRQIDCPDIEDSVSKTILIKPKTKYYCSSVYPTLSDSVCIATNNPMNTFLPICDYDTQVDANRFGTSCYNISDLTLATKKYTSCTDGYTVACTDLDCTDYTCQKAETYCESGYKLGSKCYETKVQMASGECRAEGGVFNSSNCYFTYLSATKTRYKYDASKLDSFTYSCSGDLVLTDKCPPDASKAVPGSSCASKIGQYSLYNGVCYLSAPAIKNDCYTTYSSGGR